MTVGIKILLNKLNVFRQNTLKLRLSAFASFYSYAPITGFILNEIVKAKPCKLRSSYPDTSLKICDQLVLVVIVLLVTSPVFVRTAAASFVFTHLTSGLFYLAHFNTVVNTNRRKICVYCACRFTLLNKTVGVFLYIQFTLSLAFCIMFLSAIVNVFFIIYFIRVPRFVVLVDFKKLLCFFHQHLVH